MDEIKVETVETLTDTQINWEPCFEIKEEDYIPIEYIETTETHYKSPEKLRPIIVPKSELGSEYAYILEADISICESVIDLGVSTDVTCDLEEQEKCNTTDRRLQQIKQIRSQRGKTRSLTFKCDNCLKAFKSTLKLNEHKRSKCRTSPGLRSNRVDADKKRFECHECSYKCDRLTNLKRHMIIHTEDRPHQCDQCQIKFRDVSDLRRHIVIHVNAKRYECYVCSYKSHRLTDVRRHMLIHTGEKPFQCNFKECSYGCTRRYILTKHMRIHTKKPNQCNQGQKEFRIKNQLKRHKLIRKPFECKECSYKAGSKWHLMRHLQRIHEEKACKVCHRKFFTIKALKQHLHQHSDIFECDYCSTKMENKVDLIKHMEIHVAKIIPKTLKIK